jgi:hypothetical protein
MIKLENSEKVDKKEEKPEKEEEEDDNIKAYDIMSKKYGKRFHL